MTIANADKATGRQYPLVAYQEFDLADLTTATAVTAIKIPAGSIVVGGELVITQVFNSTSSDAIDIGDDGDDDRYTSSAVNAQALGRTALTLTGYQYTAANTIDIVWTSGGGTPTTGAGYLMVMYITEGRANEVVPDYS